MNIVADENIALVREAFTEFGDVETLPGREITASRLRNTEVLLVRTVTRVNAALLDDTPVRFVASATAGFDHVDTDYLDQRGIPFAYAPGSNANSVAEYVAAALLVLADKHNASIEGRTLGIVGYGHVGRRVREKAEALGLRCVVNDPPLARTAPDPIFRPIEEILDCDIITMHVSLETGGPDPTHHLVDEAFLEAMKDGATLLNTARGGVVDEAALKRALQSGKLAGSVLDVWENEPEPDPELMRLADIATPHIAGYAYDGKLNGTRQVYEALCAFQDVESRWEGLNLGPNADPANATMTLDASEGLTRAVSAAYDIMADHRTMHPLVDMDAAARARSFDALRKGYPLRREFTKTIVRVAGEGQQLEQALRALGFQIEVKEGIR